jgi:hypothetical protein
MSETILQKQNPPIIYPENDGKPMSDNTRPLAKLKLKKI